MKSCLLFFLSLFFGCAENENITQLSKFIKDSNLQTADAVYVISDNSCSICFQMLKEDIKNTNIKNRYLIILTDKIKFSYESFFLHELFLKINFYTLSRSAELNAIITNYTKDIKGPYKMTIDNDKIIDISVVSIKKK